VTFGVESGQEDDGSQKQRWAYQRPELCVIASTQGVRGSLTAVRRDCFVSLAMTIPISVLGGSWIEGTVK